MLNWSQEWKLNLNADKSEVCPFSTWSNDSTWQPALFLDNQKILVNVTPRLLSDRGQERSVKFNAHLKKLTTSLSTSLHIIRVTAYTFWIWSRSTLKIVFNILIGGKLDYAAPAWQPWLSTANLSCLDYLQNFSLRLITSQLVSTPLEADVWKLTFRVTTHAATDISLNLKKSLCAAPMIIQNVSL